MKAGSLVKCKNGGGWYDYHTKNPLPGPSTKEICIVEEVVKRPLDGEPALILQEYRGYNSQGRRLSYHVQYFREMQPPLEVNISELISEPLMA